MRQFCGAQLTLDADNPASAEFAFVSTRIFRLSLTIAREQNSGSFPDEVIRPPNRLEYTKRTFDLPVSQGSTPSLPAPTPQKVALGTILPTTAVREPNLP
jgi:hypothetical protein